MSKSLASEGGLARAARGRVFYGWVIVGASMVILTMHAGVTLSFALFFKPLIADFGWNRAATAGIQSVFLICFNGFAIVMGILVDRFGPRKIALVANTLAVLGLLLASQVRELWQLYLTYGVMTGLGVSGNYTLTVATVSRWFVRLRGMALGLTSAGIGIGTLVLLPVIKRLIASFGWSGAYIVLALAVLGIIGGCSLLLRRDPATAGARPYGADAQRFDVSVRAAGAMPALTLGAAFRTRPLQMLSAAYFGFGVSMQIILVHLVNYATDQGISPAIAATLMRAVGLGSLSGRLSMGAISDRIGYKKGLAICFLLLTVSLVWLMFSQGLWMFYAFAFLFGYAYGGEAPAIVALFGQFFGMRAISMIVGAALLANALGGALGSWSAGRIFDVTQSYSPAFVVAIAFSLASLVFTLVLRSPPRDNHYP
ncbi:MAG: MFS transporter [Chloroflexi bacterium]|nr:MFS transporter [Chloroflexota bacterium]